MKPVLILRGGGAIGNEIKIYPSYPLVSLEVYDEKLLLKIWPFWTYEIFLKDIEAIQITRRYYFTFFQAIKIKHHGQAPAHIEFVSIPPSKINELLQILKDKGIRVDNSIEAKK